MRPMLAEKINLNNPQEVKHLKFPLMASPKLDGVRALIKDGQVLSRTLKPIPNKYVQEQFGRLQLAGLDGELIVGSPTDPHCLQKTMSGVMAYEGQPDVSYHVFDSYYGTGTFKVRNLTARGLVSSFGYPDIVKWLPQEVIHNLPDLLKYEQEIIDLGYEGIILRDPEAPYKYGRSTLRQAWMLKVKRFADSEARVKGCIELEHNSNHATLDERGYTKRSSCQSGKVPMGVLGAFQVFDVQSGVEFEIGTGFTEAQRVSYWQDRHLLIGQLVKYKHFPVGVKDKPRHPMFLGFRDPIDL